MWTFKPGLDSGWGSGHTPYYNLEDMINYVNFSGESPYKDIKAFLTHSSVVPLIKLNKWEEIFQIWSNKHKRREIFRTSWCVGVLADFLYYSGINFWDYLSEDTDLKNYELSKGLKWRD